jgi:hypothetical protein
VRVDVSHENAASVCAHQRIEDRQGELHEIAARPSWKNLGQARLGKHTLLTDGAATLEQARGRPREGRVG